VKASDSSVKPELAAAKRITKEGVGGGMPDLELAALPMGDCERVHVPPLRLTIPVALVEATAEIDAVREALTVELPLRVLVGEAGGVAEAEPVPGVAEGDGVGAGAKGLLEVSLAGTPAITLPASEALTVEDAGAVAEGVGGGVLLGDGMGVHVPLPVPVLLPGALSTPLQLPVSEVEAPEVWLNVGKALAVQLPEGAAVTVPLGVGDGGVSVAVADAETVSVTVDVLLAVVVAEPDAVPVGVLLEVVLTLVHAEPEGVLLGFEPVPLTEAKELADAEAVEVGEAEVTAEALAAAGLHATSARPPAAAAPPASARSRRPAAAASGAKPSTATRREPSPRLDKRGLPIAPGARTTGWFSAVALENAPGA